MSQNCKLNCSISGGMFANEYVASVKAVNPDGTSKKEVHLFVDKGCLEKVNSKDGSAQLRAVKVGETKAGIAIVLPQATFENGPSVMVPRDIIVK